MKKHYHIFQLAMAFLFLASYSSTTLSAEHIIIPKFGTIERSENLDHSVDNNLFDLDDDIVAAAGATYLYKLDNGIAFGASVFGYENEIIATTNNDGDAITGHIYGIVEKYFNAEGAVKPYIGMGLGFASTHFDGSVNGNIDDDYVDTAVGLSYEIIAGIEIDIQDNIGMIIEYNYFDFEIDDDIDNRDVEIESDGHALFFGVAIHF